MLALFIMLWILFYLFFVYFYLQNALWKNGSKGRKYYYIWRKETMKRRLALLLGAAMLTVSLAGCSGGGDIPAVPPPTRLAVFLRAPRPPAPRAGRPGAAKVRQC